MALVDDPPVLGGLPRFAAEEILDGTDEFGLQGAGGLRVGEDVVGRDAGLTGVEELAAGEPVGDDGQVGPAVDERRGFPAQFERDRGEVFGGGPHHDAADGAVAGVEDVVEALCQQRGGLLDGALDDRDGVGVQVPGQQPRDDGRGGGGELAGLDDDRVARGQRRASASAGAGRGSSRER